MITEKQLREWATLAEDYSRLRAAAKCADAKRLSNTRDVDLLRAYLDASSTFDNTKRVCEVTAIESFPLLVAELRRVKGLAQELAICVDESEKSLRDSSRKWHIANTALWIAVDAFHRHDTPRDTETDDVHHWRQEAEDKEGEREDKGLNTIPIFVALLQNKLKRPDVRELLDEEEGV